MNPSTFAILCAIIIVTLLHFLGVVALADLICRSAGKPSLWPVLWHYARRSAPYALLMAALLCVPPAWCFVLGAVAWIMGRTTA